MLYKRIIAKLDIKSKNVVKGIHMEGLRIVGKPSDLARKYYEDGADELIFIDTVASLYGRNHLKEIIKDVSEELYIPLTVGGGICSIKDIQEIINMGADKVAINTYAVKNKDFITKASRIFGSQAIVISIQAKIIDNDWIVFIENGREITELKVLDWVKEAVSLGAGEILLTSIDKDGTKKGFDIDLYNTVCGIVNIPVIACGGAGSDYHIENVLGATNISGVAIGSIIHYNISAIKSIKKYLHKKNVLVRNEFNEKVVN
jgi:imidazole glycerol-phosphate synthase subunit HisF